MEENINALNEINKGVCMGVDAINDIIPKVKNKELVKLLEKQKKEYKVVGAMISKAYPKYNAQNDAQKTSLMSKVMTWYGIEMRTMKDDSDSKLVELILQGTNMGIIEGRKILNNKNMDKEVIKITNAFISLQEKCLEDLKGYL